MTRETLRALSDAELRVVGAGALEESQERKQRRRQKVLDEIKALVAQEGLSDIVAIQSREEGRLTERWKRRKKGQGEL
jgi:hypothetical protein